jgi:hypothetical protein
MGWRLCPGRLCLKGDEFLPIASYRVNEFFCVFTEHQIMSYVFSFVVKILLILTLTFARLTKLWTTPLLTSCGGLHLKCRLRSVWIGFRYTFMVSFGPRFITKTSKNGGILWASTFIVNLMVGLKLLIWPWNCCDFRRWFVLCLAYVPHLVAGTGIRRYGLVLSIVPAE